ncbi:MAG: lamin tail domain-containing protein [Flavobacteriaceae bacterium]|nr:lamin tail domain-containing protein [Flavobacteriaceae bacterium]MDZ4149166.1 lamin tail domain-containing protein [Flavobacteriaceae bacterium]
MRKKAPLSKIFVFFLFAIQSVFSQSVIISQYIETSSGTTPKGIEIFNISGADIVFSPTNSLEVYQGTNGAAIPPVPPGLPSPLVSITSGTLPKDGVWVIGTADLVTYVTTNAPGVSTTKFAFVFNGNDALQIRLGSVIQDNFGMSGVDPGTAWTGGGVSTANSNIAVKDGICSGDLAGWTDPSIRFTTAGTGLLPATGFGVAPASCSVPTSATINASPSSLTGFNYTEFSGPSAQQSFAVSGTNLTDDITLSAPAGYEISTVSGSGFGNAILLVPTSGSVVSTTIYVRLKAGLTAGTYNQVLTTASAGATTRNISLAGNVVASTCTPATIASVSPLSGPEGTVVTITASSGNLTGAIVTIGGVNATVLSSNATTLKVAVPAGAKSGAIVIEDTQPCDASAGIFTVLSSDKTNCDVVSSFSELFISEVTDATSGSLSYIEIANATPNTIDMSGYTVRFVNNGTSTTNIPLTGILAPGDSFTLATNTTDANCPVTGGNGSLADQINVFSGVNDNDCISLLKGAAVIDVWGVCGANTNWTAGLGLGSKGYDFQRKSTSIAPNLIFNSADWTIIDFDNCNDNYVDIENYSPIVGLPVITANPIPPVIPVCSIVPVSFTVSANEGMSGGKALAFQWYYSAPGDAGWTALTNSAIFSGVTTNTLSVSSIVGLNQYQFYCQVREDSQTCFRASVGVQLDFTTTESTWNGAWTNGTPLNTTLVAIDANFDTAVNGNIDACGLVVNPSYLLDIKAGNYVNIVNDLTVLAGANLQVQHEGSLVMGSDTGVVTVNGNLDVHKTTSPMVQYDYSYWSSPVNNTTIASALSAFRPSYVFRFEVANFADVVAPFDGFDDDGNDWVRVSGSTVMTPGVGYIGMGSVPNATPQTHNAVFNGVVNNGLISVPLSLSANNADSSDDWNLIGNPYPSAIDAAAFYNDPNNSPLLGGSFYLWTHNTAISNLLNGPDKFNFTSNDYAIFTVGTGGVQAGSGGTIPAGKIASGQAFFVEAIAAGNVQFKNSMRVTTGNNQFFRANRSRIDLDLESSANELDRIWLNLTNEQGAFSQILIGYIEGATNNTDVKFDGLRLDGSNYVSFYSLADDNTHLAIQGKSPLDDKDTIRLGFETQIDQVIPFQISIQKAEGKLAKYQVVLEDKYLNVFHDFIDGNYVFNSDPGVYKDRFTLIISKKSKQKDKNELEDDDHEEKESRISVYSEDKKVIVNSSTELISEVSFFDMTGRLIKNENDINILKYKTVLRGKSEIIIVKILLQNGERLTKKIKL